MSDIFNLTARPRAELFFRRDDPHDPRLGEIVSTQPEDYDRSEIVILGCPQDEGVRRNRGRTGAAAAPDAIRRAFYKLTDFGVTAKIFDLGNTVIQPVLEETHDRQIEIVRQLIRDNKKIISLGGGNDISYPDCRALSEDVGAENVLAFNIDQHFDVRADSPRNSGTPYRQLLEERWILPENFYLAGWQLQASSAIYFEYLHRLGVNLQSLAELRIMPKLFQSSDLEAKTKTPSVAANNRESSIFWGFDVDVVRAADAPGTSAPSPIGLTAEEFCEGAAAAGKISATRIVEFTEVNPNFDLDGRTAKLVAIAMHRFCAAASLNSKKPS